MPNPAAAIHKRPAKQKHNKKFGKAKMAKRQWIVCNADERATSIVASL